MVLVCFTFMQRATCGELRRGKHLERVILSAVLSNMSSTTLFTSLTSHMLDTAADDNHVHALVKVITTCFAIIRLHHLGERLNEVNGDKVRKKLSKLILFKHQ